MIIPNFELKTSDSSHAHILRCASQNLRRVQANSLKDQVAEHARFIRECEEYIATLEKAANLFEAERGDYQLKLEKVRGELEVWLPSYSLEFIAEDVLSPSHSYLFSAPTSSQVLPSHHQVAKRERNEMKRQKGLADTAFQYVLKGVDAYSPYMPQAQRSSLSRSSLAPTPSITSPREAINESPKELLSEAEIVQE
jgi:hypothetical protein